MDKPDVDSIEGLSPAISIDQKTTSRNPRSTVGTVTEIYDYLRLLWARVGPSPLLQLRSRHRGPVRRADRGPGDDAPGGEQVHGARARRARPQGRVPGHARDAARRGLHARQGRRGAAAPRGGDRARQEAQARHRGGGGPAGDALGPAQAPHRLGRDRRGPRRGHRGRGERRHRGDHHLLGPLHVPPLRHLDAGARAADVLVQLPARRLPALHRARLADGDRPGADRAGPEPVAGRRRHPALVHERLQLLRADDAGDRGQVGGGHGHRLGGPPGGRSRLLPVRHQRRDASTSRTATGTGAAAPT